MLDRKNKPETFAQRVCYTAQQALRIAGEPISQDDFQNLIEQGEWYRLEEKLVGILLKRCERISAERIPEMIRQRRLVLILTKNNFLNVIGQNRGRQELYEIADPDYDRPVFLKLSQIPIKMAYVLEKK